MPLGSIKSARIQSIWLRFSKSGSSDSSVKIGLNLTSKLKAWAQLIFSRHISISISALFFNSKTIFRKLKKKIRVRHDLGEEKFQKFGSFSCFFFLIWGHKLVASCKFAWPATIDKSGQTCNFHTSQKNLLTALSSHYSRRRMNVKMVGHCEKKSTSWLF